MASSVMILIVRCACLVGISNAGIILGKSSAALGIVDTWMSRQPGGAVAAATISPSETEYYFAGKLSPNNPTTPSDQTIFEVGSITKGFTGLLLADQVLSGKVLLNDTLMNLLTDWPGRFRSKVGDVTLLELTTHSAGLPWWPDNMNEDPYVVYTKKELYDWLDIVEPLNRGSFAYSNAGVSILGTALAVTAGQPYVKLLKERVLGPLDLRDATITLNEEQKRRLAPGHGPDGQLVKNYPFEVFEPAGALKFSVAELIKFLQFTTGLKEHGDRMREALELSTRLWGDAPLEDHNTIGLGWMRLEMPQNQLLIWHSGSTAGYNAFAGWLPERQIGVAVLASLNVASNYSVNLLALDLLNSVTTNS